MHGNCIGFLEFLHQQRNPLTIYPLTCQDFMEFHEIRPRGENDDARRNSKYSTLTRAFPKKRPSARRARWLVRAEAATVARAGCGGLGGPRGLRRPRPPARVEAGWELLPPLVVAA